MINAKIIENIMSFPLSVMLRHSFAIWKAARLIIIDIVAVAKKFRTIYKAQDIKETELFFCVRIFL